MSLFKNKRIFTAKYRIKTRAFEPSAKKERVAFAWIKKKPVVHVKTTGSKTKIYSCTYSASQSFPSSPL